jgi:hypothetical protein
MRYLLLVVYEVAGGAFFDSRPPREIQNGEEATGGSKGALSSKGASSSVALSFKDVDAVAEQIGEERAGLIKSIITRALHGGMKGDMFFLKHYAKLWLARFLAETSGGRAIAVEGGGRDISVALTDALRKKIEERRRKELGETTTTTKSTAADAAGSIVLAIAIAPTWLDAINIAAATTSAPAASSDSISNSNSNPVLSMTLPIKALSRDDYTFQGIDFHVSSVIDKGCRSLVSSGVATVDEMRAAMWFFSSGVQHRLLLDGTPVRAGDEGKVKRTWTAMKDVAESWMKKFIRENCD